MSYELNKQDIYDFAASVQTEKKEKGNELFFKECPYCKGGHAHDKNTFSINLDNGTFKCFRSGCGKQGHFVELARDFGFQLDFGEIKQYKPVSQKKIEVRPRAIEYMESRGISKDIVERYSITSRKDNNDILVFPFHDENNVRQFIKYRNTKYSGKGNKEWCEKDAKPILFGMAQCDDFGTLIITEGQIDSLSVAECGIKNAVSVPTGAMGFTWFQFCQEWISKFQEVVIFGDCEKGRITLVDELTARLTNKIRVVRMTDYLGEKDANAILTKYGKQAVISAVENAEVPKLRNVKDLSTVKSVDLSKLPKIKTGINPLDRAIGGLYLGQVTILSGKRGEGKSTLMSQIIAEAMEQEITSFVYSGELPDFMFKGWLDLQLAGRKNLSERTNEYGDKFYSIPDDVQEKISNWYQGRCYIYDNGYIPDKESETETLIDTIEKTIKQYDVKLICIDNLMTAMEGVKDNNDLYMGQSNFVGRLKKIAMKYNVAVVLVAHPKKVETKDGKSRQMSNEDLMGSGDISNKVDVVIYYNRIQGDDSAGAITVTKNRLNGKLVLGDNAIMLNYSASCKRISSIQDGSNKTYGWEVIENSVDGFSPVQTEIDCPW